jgi:O-succinylbenzoic acid--CoA ligase
MSIDLDHDGDALILEDGRVTWRELRATPPPPPGRVRVHEERSASLVVRLFACLRAGSTPVLAHPRWPADMAERAFARAGEAEGRATVLFTSGSTGEPKVVVHDEEAHLASAKASGLRTPFGPGDRWLLSLPLCHVGGLSLLYRAADAGGALAIPAPGSSLTSSLERLAPTHVSLVATQLRRLLDDDRGRAALARAREVLVGGGPCPEGLIARAREAGVPLRQTYGCTEMASQVCTSARGAAETCGAPLPGYEVRVDDGEILVRGPSAMRGVDGWYRTGDLGRVDEDRLTVVGRRDNLFISGGENIQPEAIERALAGADREVIVVPVADEEYGARPVAFVRGPLDGVEALARERLPSFMRPVAWHALGAQAGLKPRRDELTRRAARLSR